MLRKRTAAGLILVAAIFTPLTGIQAQGCEIDLTDAIIRLTQAQADDDISAALAAIASVQAQLDEIQAACANAVPSGTSDTLGATYSAPDDLFSFDYPAGWFEGDFHPGRGWAAMLAPLNTAEVPIPEGGSLTVTSIETPLTYSPYVALEGLQSVTVLVGSPMHLFNELGLYSEAFAEEFLAGDFDFEALVAALEAGIRQSPMQPDLLLTQIDAERPTFGFEAFDDDTNIALVLVALDEAENLYALLVSPTLVDDQAEMLPLLETIAATVR